MTMQHPQNNDHLESTLAPCPFCGSKLLTHGIYMSAGCIECMHCGAMGPEVIPEDDIDKAEAAWNKRANTG